MVAATEDSPEQMAEVFRYQVSTMLGSLQNSMPLGNVESFIAVGGDARFAVRQVGRPTDSPELHRVDPAEFDKLVSQCERWTAEEIAKRFGVPFAEAETVNPALMIYQKLFRLTKAREMIVSGATMRDGLLLELAHRVTGKEDRTLAEGVIHSAMAIAQKYHVDLGHAETVADVVLRLFDEPRPDHGLNPRHRLLLARGGPAARSGRLREQSQPSQAQLLPDRQRGDFRAEPRRDRADGAGGAIPSPQRPEAFAPRIYVAAAQNRVTVSKLAAILRVADALSRGHVQAPTNLNLQRQGDDLIISVPNTTDLLLEQRAVRAKADMFEEIFGMKVRLELA